MLCTTLYTGWILKKRTRNLVSAQTYIKKKQKLGGDVYIPPLTPDQPPFPLKGGCYLCYCKTSYCRSEGFPRTRLFHPWARWGGAWWPGIVPCRCCATRPGPGHTDARRTHTDAYSLMQCGCYWGRPVARGCGWPVAWLGLVPCPMPVAPLVKNSFPSMPNAIFL